MRPHNGAIEHPGQMRRGTHRRQGVGKRLEHVGPVQSLEPRPDAVPGAEFRGEGSPAYVLDREEVQRLQKLPIILGLRASPAQARKTPPACAPSPLRSSSPIWFRPLNFSRRSMNNNRFSDRILNLHLQ